MVVVVVVAAAPIWRLVAGDEVVVQAEGSDLVWRSRTDSDEALEQRRRRRRELSLERMIRSRSRRWLWWWWWVVALQERRQVSAAAVVEKLSVQPAAGLSPPPPPPPLLLLEAEEAAVGWFDQHWQQRSIRATRVRRARSDRPSQARRLHSLTWRALARSPGHGEREEEKDGSRCEEVNFQSQVGFSTRMRILGELETLPALS